MHLCVDYKVLYMLVCCQPIAVTKVPYHNYVRVAYQHVPSKNLSLTLFQAIWLWVPKAGMQEPGMEPGTERKIITAIKSMGSLARYHMHRDATTG